MFDQVSPFLQTVTPWLLRLAIAGIVVAIFYALKHYLDLRQGSFFILRQRTRRKLRDSVLIIVLLGVLVGALLFWQSRWPAEPVAQNAPTATPVPSATLPRRTATPRPTEPLPTASASPTGLPTATRPFIPTNTPTLTPSLTPSITPTPTPSTTPTPSATPTPSLTPSITPTPSPTVPILEAIYTPVSPSATVPAGAQIGELTISQSIELNGTPINPGDTFQNGQPILFVSFDFSGMVDGVLWRHIWLREGALVGGATRLWEWSSSGRTYFFLRLPDGFEPGDYEVQMMLEDEIVQTAQFTIAR